MVKELERHGLLKKALEYAVDEARAEHRDLLKAGSNPYGAREIVMQKYLFLSTEEDEPDSSLFLRPFF